MIVGDATREWAWRQLVASMPGDTHDDRVLSLLLYTVRCLAPTDATVRGMTITVDLDGRPALTFDVEASKP